MLGMMDYAGGGLTGLRISRGSRRDIDLVGIGILGQNAKQRNIRLNFLGIPPTVQGNDQIAKLLFGFAAAVIRTGGLHRVLTNHISSLLLCSALLLYCAYLLRMDING